MSIHLNVFSPIMLYGVWAISHAALLAQYNFIAFIYSTSNSCIRFLIHNNSQIALVIPLYSASANDLATTYFILLQVTKFSPTNVKYPDVDYRSSIDATQSASVYPSIFKFSPFLNKIPLPGDDFRYLKTRVTTFMCSSLGEYMN